MPISNELVWKTWDFKKPSRVPKTHEDILFTLFTDFAKRLTTHLSSIWQETLTVSLEEVLQAPFSRYCLTLPNPTFMATFELCPFNCKAILEVNSPLLHTAINHMLGSEDKSPLFVGQAWRDLEHGLTRKFMNFLLRELNKSWEPLFSPVTFVIRDLQTSAAEIETIPKGETCLVFVLRVNASDVEGLITIALPANSLIPLTHELDHLYASLYSPPVISTLHPSHLDPQTININLTAVLGKSELDEEDLTSLQVGDILDLGQSTHQPIHLQVEGMNLFEVIPGLSNRSKAVLLQSVIEKEW